MLLKKLCIEFESMKILFKHNSKNHGYFPDFPLVYSIFAKFSTRQGVRKTVSHTLSSVENLFSALFAVWKMSFPHSLQCGKLEFLKSSGQRYCGTNRSCYIRQFLQAQIAETAQKPFFTKSRDILRARQKIFF